MTATLENDLQQALPEALRLLLGKVRRNIVCGINATDLSLNLAEAHVLYLIAQETATPNALAVNTGYDKAVVARSLKQLEALGFILKEQSAVDRRCFNLSLTDAGQKAYQKFYLARQQAHAEIFSALTLSEQQQLTHLLEKCVNALDDKA